MNKTVIIVLTLISISKMAYCQSNNALDYYDSLKNELIQETNIKNIKMFHEKYKDGIIKRLYYTIPIDTSSAGCEWLTGPFYSFYKSGQLKFYLHIDPISHVCDSLIEFYDNGKIRIVDTYPESNSIPLLSSKLSKTGNCETQYYIPGIYLEKILYYKKGKMKEEFIKYIDTSEGFVRIDKTVTKKYDYKNKIIKIEEKLANGQVVESIEIMN